MKPRILLIPDLLKGLDLRWQDRIIDLLIDKIVAGGRVIFTADIRSDHSGVHNLATSSGHLIEKTLPITDIPAEVAENFTSYQMQFLMGTGEILLEMDGVHIRYGSKTILQDIHWTICSGDKWNIQGANGAGKSTLISLVNSDNPQGYSQPITMFGMAYGRTSIWERKARIAYFGSDFFQYFQSSKTIEQVLHQQLKTPYLDTVLPPETLILELMHWFGLWEFRETPYQTVQPEIKRQTLLLATYLKSSDILVLDEPYQDFRQNRIGLNNHFLEAIHEHSSQTVLFVTHRADHKPRFLNRILHLKQGRIIPND